MKWKFSDSAPIYLQIVSGLQKAIINGTYPPGSRLPSVRELALEAGVNPNTMQRALAELERASLVYSVRTSGRFVTDDTAVLASLRKDLGSSIIEEFFSSLRAIGMTDREILEAVSRRVDAGGLTDGAAAVQSASQPTAPSKAQSASQPTSPSTAQSAETAIGGPYE